MATIAGIAVILVGVLLLLVPLGFALREGQRAGGSFGIGGVLTDMGNVFVQARLLFAISLLLVGVPFALLFEWAHVALSPDDRVLALLALPYAINLTVGLVMALVATGVALDILDGDAPDFSRALFRGLRVWPIAFVLNLGEMVVIGLGLLLLLVPGLLLMTLLALWMPVLVRGDGGWADAYSRSIKLTEGGRWRLLLVLVIMYVVATIPAGAAEMWMPTAESTLARLVHAGASAFMVPIAPVLMASAYHRLRQDQEGLASDRVEAVFA